MERGLRKACSGRVSWFCFFRINSGRRQWYKMMTVVLFVLKRFKCSNISWILMTKSPGGGLTTVKLLAVPLSANMISLLLGIWPTAPFWFTRHTNRTMKKIVSVVAYFSFIQETFIIKHVQYIQLRFTERLPRYACPYTRYSKEESRNLKLTLSDAPTSFPPQCHRL